MNRSAAVARSLTALINDDVEGAVEISSAFHGGAGSLYGAETADLIRFILDHDFTPDPTIKPKILAMLRVAAAAMELWGDVRLEDFVDVSGKWRYKHPPGIFTRLLYTAGVGQHGLQELRRMGAEQVKIRSHLPSGHCPACSRDIDTIFPIEHVPFLPHRDCTCDSPCQCSYAALPTPSSPS